MVDPELLQRVERIEQMLQLLVKALYRNKFGKIRSLELTEEENNKLDDLVDNV